MDTVMLLTVYGDNAAAAAKACEAEVYRIDNLLSTGIESSEISVLNSGGGGDISSETAGLLSASLDLYEMTGGMFDITVYPIVSAWGFYSGDYTVLSEEDLLPLLTLVGSDKLLFDGNTVMYADKGMAIDLGGVGKGYASDRLRTIFKENGITSALASLGGNVVAYGAKPDGSSWNIAVQDPDDLSGYIGILNVTDKMVVTSGAYQRYFESDGQIYHHIIDPETGIPADSGLKSVTIVSDSGVEADGLSTALYVMGTDASIDFWRASDQLFDAVLVTSDDTVYITSGLQDVFTCETNYEVIAP